MLAKHAAIVPLSRWTDLSKKVLASESDLRDVLGQVALREGIHLDLARTANRYSDASHGLSLHARTDSVMSSRLKYSTLSERCGGGSGSGGLKKTAGTKAANTVVT